MEGVSIIIPTYNGGVVFKRLLHMISKQRYEGEKQIIVIDSGSDDGTCEEALKSDAELIKIDKKDFHHSRTRNQAIASAVHPYVILMVQDAIPLTETWLANMVNSLEKDDVAGVYGRQIPHDDADLFAMFSVDYHSSYLGNKNIIQGIAKINEFNKLSYEQALFLIRFDDVCAIYKREIVLANRLPEVPFAEDMAWAFEVMKKGYKVKYDPTIMVAHSHNRSKVYHFKRAVIDAISCVRILGKESEDYSYLTANDLLIVRDIMHNIVEQKFVSIGKESIHDFRTAAKMSLFKKLQLKIARRCRHFVFVLASLKLCNALDVLIKKHMLEAQLNNMLRFAINNYPANEEDIKVFIEKAAFSIVGSYWGRVYASHEIRGSVPKDIEELVQLKKLMSL